MKIALYNLTTTVRTGGVETHNWEMARALSKRGHTVHIYGGRGNIQWSMPDEVLIFKFPYLARERLRFIGSRARKLVERISFSLFAFKTLIGNRYDVIYISKSFDMPVAILASRLSGAKTVFTSGGTEFFPLYKFFIKKMDFVFSVSQFNACQIEQYAGIRPKILPNGINTELFAPMLKNPEILKKLQLDESSLKLITASRLVGWKGIQHAIEAVLKLIKKGYKLKYLIAGDGEYKIELQNLVKKFGLEQEVLFLGIIPNHELPSYYALCDIALFPSVSHETFGISVGEALSCGVPVIATNVGGIPEVVSEECAFLVSPCNADEIAEKIDFLYKNRELIKAMGEKGRKWILENFAWDKIAERFERLVKKF